MDSRFYRRIDGSQREWEVIQIKSLEESFGEADIILQKLLKSLKLVNLSPETCAKILAASLILCGTALQVPRIRAVVGYRAYLEYLSELLLSYFQYSSDPFIFIMGTTDMKMLVLHVLAYFKTNSTVI